MPETSKNNYAEFFKKEDSARTKMKIRNLIYSNCY